MTTIPFADEIVTKSTTVTPSPQGDLENELFDPTQAPDELEDDLFDTSMMPDLSKSTTEPATIVPDGKFCNQKHFIKKFNIYQCLGPRFTTFVGKHKGLM